jgi:hypothetical protein
LILTAKNKTGQECQYTTELAEDLKAVHKLDVVRLFENMHGTSFTVTKTYGGKKFGHDVLEFVLRTNDPLDPPFNLTTIIEGK